MKIEVEGRHYEGSPKDVVTELASAQWLATGKTDYMRAVAGRVDKLYKTAIRCTHCLDFLKDLAEANLLKITDEEK